MSNEITLQQRLFVAEFIEIGIELGAVTIPASPAQCAQWFAYSGRDSDRELARTLLMSYVDFMFGATNVSIEQYQYAKSRFCFRVLFSSYIQIDPREYTITSTNATDLMNERNSAPAPRKRKQAQAT